MGGLDCFKSSYNVIVIIVVIIFNIKKKNYY